LLVQYAKTLAHSYPQLFSNSTYIVRLTHAHSCSLMLATFVMKFEIQYVRKLDDREVKPVLMNNRNSRT